MNPLHTLSNEELWQLFPIILTNYQECWPERYYSEKEELIETVGANHIYRITHIGSTSVVGLVAKPTIDILLEINPHTDTDELVKQLERVGYIYSPQPGNPAPHILFMKGYTPEGFRGQAYHVHIRYPGDWDELYFRDYLTEYPEVAQAYAALKLALKSRYEHDRDRYTLAKTDFIRHVTSLAREEYAERYII